MTETDHRRNWAISVKSEGILRETLDIGIFDLGEVVHDHIREEALNSMTKLLFERINE